jgi:hypothetical protein
MIATRTTMHVVQVVEERKIQDSAYAYPSFGMLKKDVKSKSVNSPGQFGTSSISTKGYMVAGSRGIEEADG